MHFFLKVIFFISLLFSFQIALSGTTDSLAQLLNNEKTDSIRIRLLIEMGEAWETVNPDSQFFYYKKAEKEALSLSEEGLRYKVLYANSMNLQGIYYIGIGEVDKSYSSFVLSLKTNKELMESDESEYVSIGRSGLGMSLLNIASIKYYKSDFSGAINDYLAAIYIKKLLNDQSGIALCINNMGLIYMAQGMDDRAMSSFQEALNVWLSIKGGPEDEKNKEIQRRISLALINMGIIQRNQKNYNAAINYYQQAVEFRQKINDLKGLSECYLNMGIAYRYLGEMDKAFLYYDKALYVFEKTDDKKAIMRTNNNIGTLFTETGEWTKAMTYFETALKYAEEAGDKLAISHIHNNVADLYNKQMKYANATQMGRKALDIADSIGSLPEKVKSYYHLMKSYAGTGNFKDAYQYAGNYITFNDSLQGTEKMKTIQEMESRYQAERKQQEIEKQKLVIRKNDEEIKRKDAEAAFQRIIVISLLAVLLLLVFLSWFIYRNYRIKKKAHREISIKNNHLEQANTEIHAQRDEIAAQRDSISNQKKHLQKVLEEQVDSIKYAQRIQKALIPAKDMLDEMILENNNCVSEYAVFFKPKDIVSGDFYWSARVGNRLVFCVADCTGHGVPGAFMSMLGVSYLNEIAKRHGVITAADIINELRASIVVSLRQQRTEDGSMLKEFNPAIPMHRDALHDVKDGMDIALCVLDLKTKELQFAGANNSLYLVTGDSSLVTDEASQQPATSNQQLIELKGDKMPIGVHVRMDPFTLQTLKMNSGDVIYIMSDGFVDQFGGKEYKKYGIKKFRKLLLANSAVPLDVQKTTLNNEFNEWRNGYKQLDDICIMSLKIK